MLSGKADVEGQQRRRQQDRGQAGAGKSTLNRYEGTPADANEKSRYKKIVLDMKAVDDLLVDLYIQRQPRQPKQIVLDLDATDDRLHGHQEGRFYHGYYGDYCYLPLYIFIGEHLVCARLRESNQDASAGSVEEVERIVRRLRRVWPEVEIVLRADSGFCRDDLMSWCEQHQVDYVFGFASNPRLLRRIRKQMHKAQRRHAETGQPARLFQQFRYRTLKKSGARSAGWWKGGVPGQGPEPSFCGDVVDEDGGPAAYTRTSTAPGERWRTGSRSNSWICLPTGPRRRRCGRIRFGYISPRSPIV